MTQEVSQEKIPEEHAETRNEKGHFLPGVSGNPGGRPKGSVSPITRIRQIFAEQPDAFEAFVASYLANEQNQKHIVEMIDGKPKQDVSLDATVNGPGTINLND